MICAVIFLVFTVLVTYGYYLKQDMAARGDSEELYSNANVRKKMVIGVVTGLALIAACTYFFQSLYALSTHTIESGSEKKEIQTNLTNAVKNSTAITSIYNRQRLTEARIVSYILSKAPEMRTKEGLAQLSDIFGLQYIMLFDENGVEILSDSDIFGFVLSDDPESQSYAFNVLKHGVPYVVQDPQPDDLTGEYHQFIGVPMTDPDGKYDGFLQICVTQDVLKAALDKIVIENVLENSVFKSENEVLAISKSTGEITYYSKDRSMAGQDALDMGLMEEQIKGNYLGKLDLGREHLYGDSFEADEHYIYIVTGRDVLFSGRPTMTIFTVLVSFLAMIVYLGYFVSRDVKAAPAYGDDGYMRTGDAMDTGRMTSDSLSRTLDTTAEWNLRPSDEKLKRIISVLVLLIGLVSFIVYARRRYLYPDNAFFGFISGRGWNKGFNVFAFTKSLGFLLHIYLAVTVTDYILNGLIRLASPRNETIIRLIKSIIKYGTAISVIFYSLTQFGFDSKSLMASAGLMTLIIGLGARDLVTDILAGIFIIFENEFQVGDIIEVGGYKGKVAAIGLRTTRVINGTQDVKSFNNRNLTNVVNRTRNNVYCDVIITSPLTRTSKLSTGCLKKNCPRSERGVRISSAAPRAAASMT